MPESPEVQELANFLDAHATGQVVGTVDVLLPKALKTASPPIDALVGARVTRCHAHREDARRRRRDAG